MTEDKKESDPIEERGYEHIKPPPGRKPAKPPRTSGYEHIKPPPPPPPPADESSDK